MESDSSPPPISFSTKSFLSSKQSEAVASTSTIPLSLYDVDNESAINESPTQRQKQMQAQLTGLGPSDPPAIANPSVKRLSCQIIFYTQFTLISILAIYLILWSQKQHHFHPKKWLPPILTALLAAGASAFAWQWLSMHHPSWILKAAFTLSPLLTSAVGFMFFHVRSESSHLLGIAFICFAVYQVLHGCWVFSQIPYATSVIEESTGHVPPNVPRLVQLTIFGATMYSCFIVCGIGGIAAVKNRLNYYMVYISVILVSLTWTMLVAVNAVQVLVGRLKYIHFTCGVQMGLVAICIDMIRHMMGSITFGSAMIPIFGVVRGPAKAITLITCGNDAVSAALLKRANWWGLVHVGVQNMDFIEASRHTWEHFHDAEMDMVIETDLTEVLCFFCGLTGGNVAALVAGFMAMSFDRGYEIELSLFAMYIGYFMCRIALAWVQASIAAYYVAYADARESRHIISLVPSRIDELKMHQQPLLSKSTS